jgi:metal-responsive CopG/Arc/MetJ family transcriptional regulator
MSWRKTKIVRQRATGRSVTVLGDTYVGLRLPSGLLDIIDTYAAANGLKRSEAIRALIDEGIIATFPHVKIAEVLSGAKIVRHRKS